MNDDVLPEENIMDSSQVFIVVAQQDSATGKSLLFSFSSRSKKKASSIAKSLAKEYGLEDTSKDYWSDKMGRSISIFRLEIDETPVTKFLFPF